MQKVAWPSTMVQNEKAMSMMSKAERSADAGDDAGQRDRQDEQQRDRLAAEELRARQRRGGTACRACSASNVAIAATSSESYERRPDIRALRPGDGEPFRRVARRRKLVALLLGGEGVEKDQRQRQMQEQKPGDAPTMRSPVGAVRFAIRATSNAPMRFATQR